jgi:ABC-type transport system involved in cytochrome c biogenesis permease component
VIARLQRAVRGWISDPNPILVKELRATFRTALFVRFLYLSTGLVALLVLSTGAAVASGELPPASVGQIVLQLFLSVTLTVLCLVAPGYASATITTEREQGTWESLELSGMSPSRIVLGKFAAAYASIALVLVALSPVVGIAFLFGGVSPLQVVVGFLSMLVALAPAIAFGVAVSARLSSTRLAIVLATVVYVPIASTATSFLGVFGEVAHREWGLGTEGPFFYTEAFATRAGEWDTWLLLVGVPLYAFGMPVWFLLASAVAGVRPAAENRSGALKVWALVMSLTTVAVGALSIAVSHGAHDRGGISMVATSGFSTLLLFYGLLFVNEPPLPPRPFELARARWPIWRRAIAAFGPGAAATLRFATVLIFGTAGLWLVAIIGARHLMDPSATDHLRWDGGAFVLTSGAAVIAWFTAAFGSWLRMVLRHGLAARVLVSALLVALAILPFLFGLILDPDSLGRLDRHAPLSIHFSVVYPVVLAIQVADHHGGPQDFLRLLVPVVTYGLMAFACWALVEARVRVARRDSELRRARFADAPTPPPSAGAVSMNAVSMNAASAEAAPTEAAPTQAVKEAAKEAASTEAAPVEAAPTEAAPAESAPAEAASEINASQRDPNDEDDA